MIKMFKNFTKKGAVFGIDARVALVIVSIASFAIAYNKQSLNESRRIKDVTLHILEIEDALMNEYKTNYHNSALFTTGYAAMSTTAKKEVLGGKAHLYEDPWGNDWAIYAFIGAENALGQSIKPACFIIVSAGPDGYDKVARDLNTTVTNYATCADSTTLKDYGTDYTQIFDDYFYKFTTLGFEIDLLEDSENRLNRIRESLIAYAESIRSTRIAYCNGLSQTTADADATCDLDTSGVYEQAELETANFYPKSSTDATAAVYNETTTYNSTVATDMENFVEKIGLTKSYAYDMASRQLNYNSNSTSVTTAPYVATLSYDLN